MELELMQANCDSACRLLRALSNPARLMVLCLLCEEEMCVSELNQHVDLGQSALSQHLAVLRRDGLVRTRRDAQTIYYSIVPGPAAEILEVLHRHYCRQTVNISTR